MLKRDKEQNAVILDDKQQALLNLFEHYAAKLESSFLKKFTNILKGKKNHSGIYIYGSVGRGKTMLTRRFFDSLTVTKNFQHFQIFMKTIHERLHDLRTKEKKTDNLINLIAKEYANLYKVIILDEFEIKDIADAMTLARLIPELQKLGVFVVITTNIEPKDLYKDGIQRDSFLPFIGYLQKHFDIFYLSSPHDYRLTKSLSLKERILYPYSDETDKQIKSYIAQLTDHKLTPKTIEVFGRSINFPHTKDNILVTNSKEMFMQERSQADYIELCKYFDIIIIERIHVIPAEDKNVALRFINFLDQAYAAKIVIITQLDQTPDNILSSKSGLKEVSRALSRLQEMNSDEYMKHSKYAEKFNG
jgi:cell division protein ZapE